MKFTEKIKQLREQLQLPQRQLASALEIDTATYSKIEKGDRRVKAEQIVIIANLLKTDKNELLTLWLADQVSSVVADDTSIAKRALKIADNSLNKK